MSDKNLLSDLETRIDFTVQQAVQQAVLEVRIVAAVQQALCNLNLQSAFMSFANTVTASTFTVSLSVQSQSEFKQALSNLDLWSWQQSATSAAELFKPADIEFFDSGQNVEDDKLWTQNVFIFIQRIKNVMTIQEDETV